MNEVQRFLQQHLAAPPSPTIRRAAFVPEIRSTSDDERTITFVSSTEATDRMGDIIRVAGWQTKAYMQNPVFLWAHNSSEPPIGKCVELHTETQPKPALVQTIKFADAATYPFADSIYRLYKGKFLRSVSVGFRPLERPTPIEDDTGRMTGFEFRSQELMELSGVPIPANQEALARAVNEGIVSKAAAVKIFDAPVVEARLPVAVARGLLAAHASRCGKPVVQCSDEQAVARATMICLVTSTCKTIEDSQPYVLALPRELRAEYDSIITRMFPSEIEEFLAGDDPDPQTLESWLNSLAGS
jgi:HK97 family phage prohead protease